MKSFEFTREKDGNGITDKKINAGDKTGQGVFKKIKIRKRFEN